MNETINNDDILVINTETNTAPTKITYDPLPVYTEGHPFLSQPTKEVDESEIKKHRLQDKNLDSKREILTLRISDYDGIWTKNYNSVYLGKLELDDGTFLHDTPIIALKDYQQQEPLSYHYIDGKKLGNRFEEECQHYSIQ